METVTTKWILDTFGPVGLIIFLGFIVYLYITHDRTAIKAKMVALDATKDLLIEQYREAMNNNTKAMDQTREVDRVNAQVQATVWTELKTIIEERIPRIRGGR